MFTASSAKPGDEPATVWCSRFARRGRVRSGASSVAGARPYASIGVAELLAQVRSSLRRAADSVSARYTPMMAATATLADADGHADADERRPHVQRVPRESIRAGRGDLAALLEVTRGPDPEQLAAAGDDDAGHPGRPSRLRQPDARRPAITKPSATRNRVRQPRHRRLPCCGRRRRRRSTAAITSSTTDRLDARGAGQALPLVMALAAVRPGDDLVGRVPRTVALGPGRPVEADHGRADGRGDVQRSGVAGHDERGPSHHRRQLADRGPGREASRAHRTRRRSRRPRTLGGSPRDERRQSVPSVQPPAPCRRSARRATACSASRPRD